MVERVEALRPELDRAALGHTKFSQQRKIENVVAGPGDDVASGVAEGIWRRIGKCGGIEEVIRRALVARQDDALSRHNIRPVRSARIREIQRKVERVDGRTVL